MLLVGSVFNVAFSVFVLAGLEQTAAEIPAKRTRSDHQIAHVYPDVLPCPDCTAMTENPSRRPAFTHSTC